MDLRQLRYAFAVAEHLGFERAARALGVSQSAVSRGVSKLEDELGIDLFERTTGGVRVTPPGEAYFRRVQPLALQWAAANAGAGALGRTESGCLAIGFYPDLSTGPLRSILAAHRARWSEVAMRFLEDAPAGQLTALRERTIDVAFLITADSAPGADSEALWDEPVFIAVPDAHRLAGAAGVAWDALRGERWLVRRFESGPLIQAWLTANLGVAGYAPDIEQQDICRASLFGLVGCGYGLSPCSLSATGVHPPGVTFVPIVGERSTVPVRMAWLGDRISPVLQRFLRLARDVAAEHRRAQA